VLSAAQTPASRARLTAAAAPSSGAFLQAIPMSSVDTWNLTTHPCALIAVSLRLGAPMCAPHDCICGMAVDSSGEHTVWAAGSQLAGRGARDAAINSIVKTSSLSSAEIPNRLEPRGRATALVTTTNDQTAWHRCYMEEWSLSYMGRHFSRYSGSKLSRQSCHGSWCRSD